MKKIIYKEQVEVFLGDTIQTNNMMVEVTGKLIKLNPDLFKVVSKTYTTDDGIEIMTPKITKVYVVGKDDLELREPNTYTGEAKKYLKYFYFRNNALAYIKECKEKKEQERQELLAEAKRKYPIGTKFKSINSLGNIHTIEDNCLQWSTYYPNYITCGPKGIIIYTKDEDKWAEVLPLKFTTEDDVDIYGDMKTYAVAKGDLDIDNPEIYGGNSASFKYFYHKENALAYIEKLKEKTLQDYESILIEINSSLTFSPTGAYISVYGWLRDNEPKLYYTKILQLIADDLNDARYIHERGQSSFHINKEGRATLHMGDDEGCVYFKSRDLAEKARDILGDKVKYLFN